MKKILLIMPDAHMHKVRFGPFIKSLREAPLTLTTIAAMIDSEKFDIKIVDESVDKIPLDYPADIVGISVLTGTACRAYRLADYFRSRKIPVVLGGAHVTIMPEEASKHADSIVVGMAEYSWPRLLDDFYEGRIKSVYNDNDSKKPCILKNVPSPRIDLQRSSGYAIPYTVQATRGCKHRCDFCCVGGIWPKFYRRPVSDVVRDIRLLPGKRIVFNDVSLVDDVEYAKELFSAIVPLGKTWGGLATARVAEDEELLDLMHKSGCRFLLIGFESFNQSTLNSIRKGFNKDDHYSEMMYRLHARDISVQGTIVFGFDGDDKTVFESTLDRVQELNIDIPRYSICTPYPGTPLHERLKAEGRMISFNWEDYDTMHVVYEPAQMTPDELFNGFKWAYKETFRFKKIIGRMGSMGFFNSVVNFAGNLTYKMFVSRLHKDPRYAYPNGYVDRRQF